MSAADIQGQLYVSKSTFAYRSPTASCRIAGPAFDIWPFTLLVYDYLLTLDWEISRYWGEVFTLTVPNVLFFTNRYGTLFGNIPVIIPYFWNSQTLARNLTMSKFGVVPPIFHRWTQVVVGVMLFLRTYALYERSKRVLVLMLALAFGTVAVGLVRRPQPIIGITHDEKHYSGQSSRAHRLIPAWIFIMDATSQQLALSASIFYLWSDASPSELRVSEGAASPWPGLASPYSTPQVFLLTLYRVFGRHRVNGLDLFTVLLRDGSIYFGVMVVSNLANILTLVIGNPYSRGIATTFTNVISSIMINRLMLNLRDPVLTHMSGRLTQNTTTTGNNWFVGDTVAGGSPVLDTLDIELSERRAVPSDLRTLRV
ncbi:hypothetical protein DFH09DRAFT_594015 [Mycena vulgaris]|nr:hypothetical protein DFH09DRAFT_594015 [Mycena vulgaris]